MRTVPAWCNLPSDLQRDFGDSDSTVGCHHALLLDRPCGVELADLVVVVAKVGSEHFIGVLTQERRATERGTAGVAELDRNTGHADGASLVQLDFRSAARLR